VKHLSIELSENAVRFSSIVNDTIKTYNYIFNDRKDYRYKEQLNEFLVESGLKELEYDEYVVSWSSFRSTLIPANVFGESKPAQLFKLCYGSDISTSEIDYNRIPEQGIVNLYEIPLWVKSFFVIKYPRSIIQHEGSHLIRGIFAEPSFKLRSTIIVYQNYFLLSIVKENKLHFYSMFEFQTSDDIVYHLMFTLQQKEFLQEGSAIQLYTGVGCSSELINDLSHKLKSLPDLKNNTVSILNDFITNSQKLCV
jgi:hypothetical protein